jgi:hypothetical protein
MLILHLSLVFQILNYLKFDVSAHPISLSKNLPKRDVLEVGVAQSHSLKRRALKQLENCMCLDINPSIPVKPWKYVYHLDS